MNIFVSIVIFLISSAYNFKTIVCTEINSEQAGIFNSNSRAELQLNRISYSLNSFIKNFKLLKNKKSKRYYEVLFTSTQIHIPINFRIKIQLFLQFVFSRYYKYPILLRAPPHMV